MLILRVRSTLLPEQLFVPRLKRFTTLSAFFPHAAWLVQAPAH